VGPVCLLSFVFEDPLLFQLSPVFISSLRKEVVKAKVHILPEMLRGGTVKHCPPVKLLLDLVELAVMQQRCSRP
jgi:hypothetical protein